MTIKQLKNKLIRHNKRFAKMSLATQVLILGVRYLRLLGWTEKEILEEVKYILKEEKEIDKLK